MFCRKCGAPNDDNAFKCVRCSSVLQDPVVKINNNLVLAIVVTVLCCLPFGLVGVVYAAQVNGKAQAGDVAGAQESARKAQLWSYWGLGIALVGWGGYLLIAVLAVAAGN